MSEKPPRDITIRLCDVVTSDGGRRLEPVVHCPRRGRSIEATTCVGCARMQSIEWEPAKGGTVTCTPSSEPALPTRPPDPSRMDLQEAAARTALHEVAQLVTVCLEPEGSLDEAQELFIQRGLRCAPVVDGDTKLVGILSRSDLLRAPKRAKVRHLMTDPTHALPEHAPIAYAIALMAFENVSEVPIVTEDGKLVGIWTAIDALRWLAGRLGYVEAPKS